MLFAHEGEMKIALDTGSEISIGQKEFLKNVRLVDEEVLVESLGGIRQLYLEGEILLAGNVEITVFAVENKDLPPGTSVLLGNPHLKGLGVSLDYAQLHPGCLFSEALSARHSGGRMGFLPRLVQHEKDESSLTWLSFGLASFALNLVILTLALFSPSFFSLMEPQALFELFVCLFACRFAWICPEMLLSSLVSTVRPPARASKTTVPQVQLKKLSSLSSNLPPAGLRDAPTAFAHYAPDQRLSSVSSVRTNPRLPPSQVKQFGDVNSRFASLFKDHRESLSHYPSPTFTRRVPTFARRASNTLPAGKSRYSSRALPQSPYKKHFRKSKQSA
jgi:hypothetical protein